MLFKQRLGDIGAARRSRSSSARVWPDGSGRGY